MVNGQLPIVNGVSVIIPVYNGGEALRRCLAALAAGDDKEREVIVVDDGSSDGSAGLAGEFGCQVLYTDRPRRGPAAARNLGAATARGNVLFFMDADVLVQPGTVSRVAAAFAADPGLAGLFGSYDDQPDDPGFLSQYKNLFHHYVHQHSSEQAQTFWSGCGAVRRDMFMQHGGFDAARYQRPCIEDIELGYRITRSGGRIRLLKDLQVKHLKRWTARSLLKSDILDRGIPWTRLLLRERAFANDLNLQAHNRVSVAAAWLLMLALLAWLILTAAQASSTGWALLAAAAAALLLALNWSLYRWFAGKRGWWFALCAIPWHWLYYGYNGVSFTAGLVLHIVDRESNFGEQTT
jgi:glycosyltransferase involved in cell wall biosynthesis